MFNMLSSIGSLFSRSARVHDAAFRNASTITLSDPYDLRPAVNGIVAKVEEARAADERVILLMGEIHSFAAHQMLQAFTAQTLKEKTGHTPVMAMEVVENIGGVFFRQRDVRRYAQLSLQNPELYKLFEQQALLSLVHRLSPLAHIAAMHFYQSNDIPTPFVDLPCDNNLLLDKKNVHFKKYARAFLSSAADPSGIEGNVHACEPLGMAIRNRAMAKSLLRLSAQSPVVILRTGLAHVMGNEAHPYRFSLHNILQGACAKQTQSTCVLSVLPATEESSLEKELSDKAKAVLGQNTTIVKGMTENQHMVGQCGIGSFAGEAATLRTLFARSGQIGFSSPAMGIEHVTTYEECLTQNEEKLKTMLRAQGLVF